MRKWSATIRAILTAGRQTVPDKGSGREKNNIEQFTRLIKDYAGIEELSAALLNTLIEKITVGEPEEIDGERVQEVKIYYKFIGNIS